MHILVNNKYLKMIVGSFQNILASFNLSKVPVTLGFTSIWTLLNLYTKQASYLISLIGIFFPFSFWEEL